MLHSEMLHGSRQRHLFRLSEEQCCKALFPGVITIVRGQQKGSLHCSTGYLPRQAEVQAFQGPPSAYLGLV